MAQLDINLLGGSTHSGHSEYGPSGPDYNSHDYSMEAFKEFRITYRAALLEEQGGHFALPMHRSYWVRVPVWLRGFFSDWWPHWSLFGGLPLYRGLGALFLLGLIVSFLKVHLFEFFQLAGERSEENSEENPGGYF